MTYRQPATYNHTIFAALDQVWSKWESGMARVILAMSGGVDSSVAAHLLLQEGHEVIGVFMRHGTAVGEEETTGKESCDRLLPVAESSHQGCCTAADAADARRVSRQMDIPFYALDLQADFHRIIDYFVDEYARGRTPNPCVVCNHWIKFGRLFDFADSVDAQFVATGHYARLEHCGGSWRLLRGVDQGKDQSYVLFGIPRASLSRMLLPVGRFSKSEIRDLAEQLGLGVADKPDSQEICFVSPGQHAHFVGRRLAERQWGEEERGGEIVTIEGECVGRHAGVEHFTVGQRKGLRVAMGEPYYVVKIDAARREVVIGPRESLARTCLTARDANWLIPPQSDRFECAVQIRYRAAAIPAVVSLAANDTFHVEFREPCYGVAPGQAAVCFDGENVLGGGWIESTGSGIVSER